MKVSCVICSEGCDVFVSVITLAMSEIISFGQEGLSLKQAERVVRQNNENIRQYIYFVYVWRSRRTADNLP